MGSPGAERREMVAAPAQRIDTSPDETANNRHAWSYYVWSGGRRRIVVRDQPFNESMLSSEIFRRLLQAIEQKTTRRGLKWRFPEVNALWGKSPARE